VTRPRSRRSRSEEDLDAKVRASLLASDRSYGTKRGSYGTRRVWHDLLVEGVSCGLHRIKRLMRLKALKARPRWRRLPSDLGERQVAAVNRERGTISCGDVQLGERSLDERTRSIDCAMITADRSSR
jgi:transposase InsO family protein